MTGLLVISLTYKSLGVVKEGIIFWLDVQGCYRFVR